MTMPASELTKFTQLIDPLGYTNELADGGSTNVSGEKIFIPMIRGNSIGKPSEYISYDPYESDNLLIDFANTDYRSESVILFCNKYGLLIGKPIFPLGDDDSGKAIVARAAADDLSAFTLEALLFQACFFLWEALSLGDSDLVEAALDNPNLEITESGRLTFKGLTGKASSQMGLIKGPSGYSKSRKIDWAFQYLCHEINRGLSRHPVTLTMTSSQRTPSSRRMPEFGASTSSLAGVIWHRLGTMVTAGEAVRRCIHCGKWFRVSGRGMEQKQYCSGACRVAAHRQRKR